jgi:hypothetical protein
MRSEGSLNLYTTHSHISHKTHHTHRAVERSRRRSGLHWESWLCLETPLSSHHRFICATMESRASLKEGQAFLHSNLFLIKILSATVIRPPSATWETTVEVGKNRNILYHFLQDLDIILFWNISKDNKTWYNFKKIYQRIIQKMLTKICHGKT